MQQLLNRGRPLTSHTFNIPLDLFQLLGSLEGH